MKGQWLKENPNRIVEDYLVKQRDEGLWLTQRSPNNGNSVP